MIIRSILIYKPVVAFLNSEINPRRRSRRYVRGMFTKRLKKTRRLLYTVKSDFFRNDSFTL